MQETEIIRRIKSGDSNAYAVLVDAYKAPLFALALRMTGNLHEAEDLVQDAFLRAFDKLHSFSGRTSFYSWLYTICLNIIRDHLRCGKLRKQDTAYDIAAQPSGSPGPGSELLQQEQKLWLEKALLTLPVKHREVLILRFFQELSFRDTAAICGISENAAKKRVYQALEKLQAVFPSELWDKEEDVQ